MKSTKRFHLIGLFLVAMLLLAACGGGEEPATAEEPAAEEQIAEEPAAEEPAAEEPSEPTEIRISYLQQFTDLHPFNINNPSADGVARGLFDTLVRADDDGNIIPWLAESWEYSDDNLTLTFHLREDVTFSDGTPMNADAVVYSAELFQDPDLFLGTSILTMVGWEAVDEYTVNFTFEQPDATALYTLAHPSTSIISSSAHEEMGIDAFGIDPVGSGPYLLEKWEPGVEVVMVKNPDYWQEGVGLADRIVWRNFQDGGAAVLATQSGELDLLHEQEPKDVPLFEGIDGFKVGADLTGWYALVLNTSMPPFDKVENRMAFAYAIDYPVLADVGFEGYAMVPDGLIPPGSWAYQPGETIQPDVEKAKEMLVAAGNPDGFAFKVSVTPQPFRSQLLQMMQASLAEVGIELEIEVNEFARHIEILVQDPAGANAAFVVQQSLHADPAVYLRVYAGCNAPIPFSGWCDDTADPSLDDLLAQSVATFDKDERTAILHEANVMEMEQFVVVPLAFQQTLHAWNADKLGDYHTTFTGGYNYLYIQPQQ